MQTYTDFGVIKNPYQGDDKKVLFVCSAGVLRSATAARLYAPKYNTRCAGSYDCALIPVSINLLLWADEVVFVNKENYSQVNGNESFSRILEVKNVRVLNIPDNHEHMAPELVQAFKDQYEDIE